MFHKKIYLAILVFLFFLFFPSKIEAINTSYCEYNDTNLILPVTVGLEVQGIDRFYPFDINKEISYEEKLFVYDETSCSSYLDETKIDYQNYIITKKYYYLYNEEKTYVDFIGGGSFSQIDRNPPKITTTFTSFIVNVAEIVDLENFSYAIRATDDIDGDLLPELIYDSYTDNYKKTGTYFLVYKACDSSNNCSDLTISIEVKDKVKPIIKGKNKYISYISSPLNTYNIIYDLSAQDNYDGDITNKIQLHSSNFTNTEPGIYYLEYFVTDQAGNNSDFFIVSIEVIDDIAPTIEGSTSYTSNLSNPISIDYIFKNLITNDNVDNSVYKNLYVVEDDYTPNKFKRGSYSLVVSTHDNSGNDSLPYLITINVIDDVAPIIDGTSEYNSYLSSPLTASKIKADLIALDNHDGNLINDIEILEDTYSNNKNSLGVYNIIYIVKDKSGNKSEPFTITIITIDDVSPVISGKNTYHSLTSKKLNIDAIKISLTATDNVDGDISSKIELNQDTYSENFHIVGTHFLTFYVADKSGNISTYYKIKIIVNENLDIIDNSNNARFLFNTNDVKSHKDILEILNINSYDYDSINIIEDTYSNNFHTSGDYYILFEVIYKDYVKKELKVNITTYTNNITENISKDEKKETIFEKIISFFQYIFLKLKEFFKKLFS